jgi:hypothetical protein
MPDAAFSMPDDINGTIARTPDGKTHCRHHGSAVASPIRKFATVVREVVNAMCTA